MQLECTLLKADVKRFKVPNAYYTFHPQKNLNHLLIRYLEFQGLFSITNLKDKYNCTNQPIPLLEQLK